MTLFYYTLYKNSPFPPYPTTNLFVFFKNLAGIGRSNFQVMFIGLLPECWT